MGKIFYCKDLSNKIKEQVKEEVSLISKKSIFRPSLLVIQVGENAASSVYVRNKELACEYCNIHSSVVRLPEDVSENGILKAIREANRNPYVNGILVQLPLPKHINEENVLTEILPHKDVDCFHPTNIGFFTVGDHTFKPCTPYGIEAILDEMNVDVAGKDCVVIGRSNIVGRPIASILTQRNGTVTVCHSKTANLKEHTLRADILIVSAGVPGLITQDMIKPGAVVIDVGVNRVNGKVVGDVLMDDELVNKVNYVTPVPGGVGVMTVAMLMKNVVHAYELQQKIRSV